MNNTIKLKLLATSAILALAMNFSAFAQNITGTITCSGVGVPDVVVSDGYEVTATDANGYYELTSEKKNGYVFYSLPGGYEPYTSWRDDAYMKIIPQTFAPLIYTRRYAGSDYYYKKSETHDFKLKAVNNNKHYLVVGADTHLANLHDDQNQFVKGFINRINEDKANAGSTPIYSTVLGDLSWDGYWYKYNFNLSSYRTVLTNNKFPTWFFPVIGNHDNDGATPATDSTDFEAAGAWRTYMGPNYYSYNLGKIHYVVLDDIFYKNLDTGSSYNTGIVGDRSYDNYIQTYELEWLKKDLSYVDTNTPIVVELHIPVWRIGPWTNIPTYANLTGHGTVSTTLLSNILKSYKTVHILSGHLHWNYHVHPNSYPNIHENSVAAVCATWWWTGYLTGRHICKDGTPGGYELFTMDGDKISWIYHSMEDNNNAQFRVYDMNSVINYYQNNDSIKALLAEYTSRTDYGSTEYVKLLKNSLLINVFNYDTDWIIEATDASGNSLSVIRYTYGLEDPLHTIAYDVPRFISAGSYTSDFKSNSSTHMFYVPTGSATSTVNIKVTDSFGNVWTKVVKRPFNFDLAMKDENEATLVGIEEAKISNGQSQIYVNGSTLCIESSKAGTAQVISLDGMVRNVETTAGHNEFNNLGLQRGIYIVKAAGQAQKIFVK